MENQTKNEPTFLEVESTEAANRVDLTIYSFIKFSDSRNCYIFKKRERWVK